MNRTMGALRAIECKFAETIILPICIMFLSLNQKAGYLHGIQR